jgi:hypothetical protein
MNVEFDLAKVGKIQSEFRRFLPECSERIPFAAMALAGQYVDNYGWKGIKLTYHTCSRAYQLADIKDNEHVGAIYFTCTDEGNDKQIGINITKESVLKVALPFTTQVSLS